MIHMFFSNIATRQIVSYKTLISIMLGRRGKLFVACWTIADRFKRGTMLLLLLREEKSFHPIAMVAKFLDDCFKLSIVRWNLTGQLLAKSPAVEPKKTVSEFRKRKIMCCVHLLHRASTWNWEVSCRNRTTTAKKCTKKWAAHAKLLFCW